MECWFLRIVRTSWMELCNNSNNVYSLFWYWQHNPESNVKHRLVTRMLHKWSHCLQTLANKSWCFEFAFMRSVGGVTNVCEPKLSSNQWSVLFKNRLQIYNIVVVWCREILPISFPLKPPFLREATLGNNGQLITLMIIYSHEKEAERRVHIFRGVYVIV